MIDRDDGAIHLREALRLNRGLRRSLLLHRDCTHDLHCITSQNWVTADYLGACGRMHLLIRRRLTLVGGTNCHQTADEKGKAGRVCVTRQTSSRRKHRLRLGGSTEIGTRDFPDVLRHVKG
jgi:hypothetical protein